jgi:hypothetical protein
MMAVTIKEPINDERVLHEVLALPLQEQARLVLMLSEQLPPSVQVRLIMRILPNVAPTIKAAMCNQTLPIVGGGTPEESRALLETWLAEPAADEDDE